MVRVSDLARELGMSPAELLEIGRSLDIRLVGAPPEVDSDAAESLRAAARARTATAGVRKSRRQTRRSMRNQGARTIETPAAAKGARAISLHSLSRQGDVAKIARECRTLGSRGYGSLELDFADATGFFPNAVVPAVASIQFYRESGTKIELRNVPEIADRMQLRNPLEVTVDNLREAQEPTSRVWAYFDHVQANTLTSAYIDCVRRRVECTAGVLEALEWCLYEVLDNVVQHADGAVGFSMLQVHPTSKRLAVCIADAGRGIRASLASSFAYAPKSAYDALTLAIQEGVTRNKETNQGNGLFGLTRIVDQNKGTLTLRSGRGELRLTGTAVSGNNDQWAIAGEHGGTSVDFQLALDKPVSLGRALNYDPPNMFLESLETSDGEHVLSIRDQAGGAGSREAARELKTLIMNILNDGAPHIVLDFEGQAVVSSSFADEVIGKMFVEMGMSTFGRKVKLQSMNETVASLVDRAVARRMQESVDAAPLRPDTL
jgi:anti-sigma regulatory factor (Ser/Thr protein kinase)